jgi:micrococcal nuclease
MRRISYHLACALLSFSLLSCDIRVEVERHDDEAPASLLPQAASATGLVQVTRVVDGDTFWVENGTEKDLRVRLLGIDAPESRKSFKKEVQYFGKEASDYLKQLIGGKKVRLVYDVNPKDRYGRTLAYVYLEDGTFVNAELVSKGYAVVMTIAPNVRYAEDFVKLQEEARKEGLGLWAKGLE